MAKSRPTAILLIGLTCLGSGVALATGRQALLLVAPPIDTRLNTAQLWRIRTGSVDPDRRRDAALLLSGRAELHPQQRRKLLKGQGWGPSALAAVSLKLAAQAAQATDNSQEADALWKQLLQRFPNNAASADALYALGRQEPRLQRQLLRQFAAHPAALAAAVEAGDALHLARWGPRWPGAQELMLQRCRNRQPAPTPQQRLTLAAGLAQLQQGGAAQDCMGGLKSPAGLQLSLGRALLTGDENEQRQGLQQLMALAQHHPDEIEGQEAAALLADEPGAQAVGRLRQLPPQLQASVPVQARLALEGQTPWQVVLRRWPRHPASWELQWQLARQALLQRRWPKAEQLLKAIDTGLLPAPLAARQLFWRGYSIHQQGGRHQAHQLWRQQLALLPGGYYGWRAAVRLELEQKTTASVSSPSRSTQFFWQPLDSGQPDLDAMWRIGQELEAWESWRLQRGGRRPQGAAELAIEGRVRTAIGDNWMGLGQLEQASLRLPPSTCQRHWRLELDQHPRRFEPLFRRAGQAAGLQPDWLLAVARQESRFSPGVVSAVGAVGLLQLMPETAAELAQAPLSHEQLQDPGRNAQLGARYLAQLLQRWAGDPFLAVASYNAGPGAVARWLGAGFPDPQRQPELWTEAIPYPETRLYTKKVLGNHWTYRLMAATGDQACAWAQAR